MTFGGRGVLTWLRGRKSVASIAAIAVLVGVPVGIAATHKGFPVSDVSLHDLDVWVTNGAELLAGRLNDQIDQLDASLAGSSKDVDVLQDGSDYFLVDSASGTVQRVDPAYVSTTEQIRVPKGSWVGYGGNTLAILSPDGRLWALDAQSRLAFDASKTVPVAQLGTGAAATVAKTGAVFAVSPKQSVLVDEPGPGEHAQVTKNFSVTDAAQLSAVGGTPVVLDHGGARLRTATKTLTLPGAGLQLQQPSAASNDVLVASASDLYRVPLDGGQATRLPAGGSTPDATNAQQVSAPVQLNGCDYGAWASSARYLYACAGSRPSSVDIDKPVTSDDLRFRVNHGVVALNDVENGNAWVASKHLTLVQNWQQLKPTNTKQKKGKTGREQTVVQTYQDAIAHRTNINHTPKPQNDTFGVRPGRTTLLPVLNNDEDPDGDVLTVADFQAIPRSFGTVELVDGGRALQLDPAPGVTGSASFRYTVTDGRSGGEASAQVTLNVHEPSEDEAPAQQRLSSVQVEQNQSITYNVLQDWLDPDGDAIYLASATKTTADSVSFTPSGDITFTNTSDQVGSKEVDFVVSDGRKTAAGKLEVTVKARGTLAPVAVPDFAQVQLGRPTTIDPLTNDTSPSGAPLSLISATSTDPSLTLDVNHAQGTISVTGDATGSSYFTYELGAGTHAPVQGLARIDVVQPASQSAAPIAVADVVYVHPGQTASVDPLDNDVSPSGRVLAVQSVSGGADSAALNIQLLDNTEVKVTSPGVLQKQVQLTYELSDGVRTVPGTITVVPVAPLVNYQPPVAVNDYVNIRAGDIATINVLDNDYSPDDQPFNLEPTLHSTKDDGGATAFVSGSTVRIQAPQKPGTYSVAYRIADEHNQSGQASVIFNVLPAGSDQAPQPQTLTARAFAGSAIPITIPLNGIDPDGDSVFFEGVTSQAKLGTVTGETATGFVYQAATSAAGTDDLSYKVVDTYGKSATGEIRIGVIPRPTTLQAPTAVNDKVEIKPGKTGAVDVLANDSDPNGYPLTLEKALTADKGLTGVGEDGSAVLFTAPQQQGDYLIHYTVSNGHGGSAGAYVQVVVTNTAKPRYPTAVDHYVDTAAAKGKASVSLDALDGATNPSGPVSALSVAVTGQNASLATVNGADVTVKLQQKRTVIAYQATDPTTKLAGKAFIILPPATVKQQSQPTNNPNQRASDKKTTAPPRLKAGLDEVVAMNASKSFALGQLIDVPSGRPASLVGGLTAQHGSVTGAGSGFTFAAAKGYRGPASVTFDVDDGKDPGAASDRITPITLPITVGAKDQSDVPPTFTPPNVQIEPGEAAKTVDLRAASYQPNPRIESELKYEDLRSSSVNGVSGTLSGSTLSVEAPVDTKPGTTAVFRFKVVPPSGPAIDGSVNVSVTSSTRPLAQQKNPPQTESTKRGTSVTLADAVGTQYWVNPFPGTPLKITDATLASAPSGVTVSHTDSSITVTVGSGASIGTVSVDYHVEDATKDPARTAQVVGQLQVTIHDHPDAPNAPSNVSASDKQATMTITAPAANGEPITKYEIRDTAGTVDTTTGGAGTVQLSNLTNGKSYAFEVRAANSDGWSNWSPASATVTPYGTPAAPAHATLSAENTYAPSPLDMSWSAVTGNATGGMKISYEWKLSDGNSGTISGTSRTTASKGNGSYHFSVRTVGTENNGTVVHSGWTQSNTVTLQNPPPSVSLSKGAATGSQSGCDITKSQCYYYDVSVKNFNQGTYPLTLYCNGHTLASTSLTVGSSGSASWGSESHGSWYCGYPDTHVTVNDVDSNHVDFTG